MRERMVKMQVLVQQMRHCLLLNSGSMIAKYHPERAKGWDLPRLATATPTLLKSASPAIRPRLSLIFPEPLQVEIKQGKPVA
jgi:hypothetical protein